MKKLLLVLLAMVMSSSVVAESDCYRRVLNDFSSDSAAFQIYDESIVEDFEDKSQSAVSKGISSLEEKLECKSGSFKLEEVSCKEVVPGNPISKVCYVESQYGYFFVSMDMMDRLNIVFNRWD